MKKIVINEKITTRGMNNLYFEIEIRDIDTESGKEKTCMDSTFYPISYERKNAQILHETTIFKFFQEMENKLWNDAQCAEYCEKLRKAVKLIEEIEKIY